MYFHACQTLEHIICAVSLTLCWLFTLILAHIKCVVTLTSWSQSRTHRMCSNMTISQTYCPLNNVSFEYSLRTNLPCILAFFCLHKWCIRIVT